MQFLKHSIHEVNPQFYNVVTGQATISSGTNSTTISFAAKNMSKTFYVFSWEINDSTNDPQYVMVMGQMISTTQIQFSTVSNVPDDITITYYVIEGRPGNPINVTHGTYSWGGTSQQYIGISAVSLTNTFCLLSEKMGGSSITSEDIGLIRLNTTTQLELRRNSNISGATSSYQIIENPRWTVSQTDMQITGGNATNTVSISGGHTFPNPSSFQVASGRTDELTALAATNLVRTEYASPTQILATRNTGHSNTWDLTVYCVDTAGDFSGEDESFNIASGNYVGTSSVDRGPYNNNKRALLWSTVFGSFPNHSSSTFAGDQVAVRIDFQDTTNVRATREFNPSTNINIESYPFNLY